MEHWHQALVLNMTDYRLRLQITDFIFHISYFIFQITDYRLQITDFRFSDLSSRVLTLQLKLQLVLFYFLFSPGLDTAQSHLVTFYIFSYMQLCQQRCTDDQLSPFNNQLLICKITMVYILKKFVL